MKNKSRLFVTALAVLTILSSLVLSGKEYSATTKEEMKSISEGLSTQQQMQYTDIKYFIGKGMYDDAYNSMVYCKLPTNVNEALMNRCAEVAPGFTAYVDELKAAGCLSSGYTLPGTSAPAPAETPATDTESTPAAEPAPEPVKTEFTVEDMPDTDMWATQQVNVRDGADTTYNKVGTLSQYDRVVVNGKASTGWYRIKTEDGSAQYVSDKFLVAEDPLDRKVTLYNEGMGEVNAYEVADTDPEVIDESAEELKEESKAETEEETVEPAPVEEPEEVEEPAPVEEEIVPEKEPFDWRGPLYIFGAVFGVCVIVFAIVMIRKKK